jgi:hypothetical protein
MSQLTVTKCTSFSLILLLIFSGFWVLPVGTPTVVGPYDWIQTGAYVRYTLAPVFIPHILLSNGTRRTLSSLNEDRDSYFKWTIIDRQGNVVKLNVTLHIRGLWFYFNPDTEREAKIEWTYDKTILVDVDIYTRESFVDGESIGKTCFWADPYAEKGDRVIVSTDPDFLEAKVGWVIVDEFIPEKQVKMYSSDGWNRDPQAHVGGSSYTFSWYTGACWQITVLGPPYDIPTDLIGNIISSYENGSSYSVLRCAGTKLGECLGLAPYINNKFWGDFDNTNIDMVLETTTEQPPQPELEPNQTESSGTDLDPSKSLTLPNASQVLSIICIVIFVVPTIVFVLHRRRKHHN